VGYDLRKEDKNDSHISNDPASYRSRGDIHHSECCGRRGQFPPLELVTVTGIADILNLRHWIPQRLVFARLFPISKSEERVVGAFQTMVDP